MPFVIGESIGQYRLVEQLGQGGMATVFKGYHARLERYVAIKALHPAFTEDENFLARFNREAKVVANLDHPNIVPIYDFSEHERRPYLVMKYIEGETLKARLTAQALTLEETLRIVEKAGDALAYAHDQGVLHRDIKPSNVLLTSDGQIYLADFGLARIAAAGESSLTADRMVGTPQYMSPEQAVAKSDLDHRSDIYSFGVMLYEMVVGQVPFNADTPFAIIHDHIYTPLPLPRTVNPEVPEAVERVLLKALAKEPEDRFETMQDFMGALRKAIRENISPELSADADGSTQLSSLAASGFNGLSGAIPSDELPIPVEVSDPAGPETEVIEDVSENGGRKGKQARKDKASKEPGKMKKRWQSMKKGWRVFWIVLAVLALLFCCLAALGGIIENGQDNQAMQQTEEAAVWQPEGLEDNPVPELDSDMPEGADPSLDEAYGAMEAALDHWRHDNLEGTVEEIEHMKAAADNDEVFFEIAFETMVGEQAWLPIVLTVLDWPMEAIEPFKEEARMVFYMAAKDPISTPIWHDHANHPYAQVAKIRNELYHGDSQLAKDKLGGLLEDEDILREYPEAHLLEAEMYVYNGEIDRARLVIRDMFRSEDMPGWFGEIIQMISMEYELKLPLLNGAGE